MKNNIKKSAARFAVLFSFVVVLIVLALCASTLFCSCAADGVSLKVVNWNAQTFFDGNNDGIEYSEFQKSKKWGIEAYTERLKKLCAAIKTLDGDVVILEEIENEGIIYDISNELAGANWNPKKVYRYGCFAKKRGASIGCAVLSRYELCGLKVHSLYVKPQNGKAPSMRPLMEVDLLAPKKLGSKNPPRRLKIFVNHWKSKSGQEGNSNNWRRWQEGLLAERICQTQRIGGESAIFCAGDFNQDISEFNFRDINVMQEAASINATDSYNAPNIELIGFESCNNVFVYSPWIDFDGAEGSYNFRGNWERIDHFFACGDLLLTEFAPQTSGAWAYDDGRPKPFKIFSLNGWSDHLPIVCRIEF